MKQGSTTMRSAGRVAGNLIAAGLVLAPPVVLAGAVAPPPRTTHGQRVLDPTRLQRVDPAYDDSDPLRTSLRELSIDLRQSDDFTHVYRVPGGRADGRDDRFARRSGGITAVFPRSTYDPTQDGVVVGIPAGTVFYLDGIPAPRPWDEVGSGLGTAAGRGADRAGPPPGAAQRLDTAISTNIRGLQPGNDGGAADYQGADVALPSGMFVGVRTLLERAAGV